MEAWTKERITGKGLFELGILLRADRPSFYSIIEGKLGVQHFGDVLALAHEVHSLTCQGYIDLEGSCGMVMKT
jgi:hypothetical protein